jgi:hypothetical protein
MSVFAKFEKKAFPYRFNGQLLVGTIAGGTPTDPKVAEGWLRTKLVDKDDLIRDMVGEVMADRGVTADEAAVIVDQQKHLNGFKRDDQGLFIEGRQLKAALKEAAMVAANAGKLRTKKWGKADDANYHKGIKAWFPEHVFVLEDRLHLGVVEATGVVQRFVHTQRGNAIQYEEYVSDAKIEFTVATDYAFTAEQWAMIWLTGEQQGIGASRSQGFGRYEVTRWGAA